MYRIVEYRKKFVIQHSYKTLVNNGGTFNRILQDIGLRKKIEKEYWGRIDNNGFPIIIGLKSLYLIPPYPAKEFDSLEETKIKIGKANKNNIISDSHKKAISQARKGKPALNRKKIILNNKTIFQSLTEAHKITGVKITSISNNLRGLSKKTKVGIWKIYE